MPVPITVPRLGWNMEEGTFAGWLKQAGDSVRAGEALFRLESDKSTEDVECLDAGVLVIPADAPREGDRVLVGAVIGHLLQPGEQAVSQPRDQPRPTASPRARRIARERGIDWTTLTGTGRTGRIRARDVPEVRRESVPAPAGGTLVPLTPIRRAIARRMLESHQDTAPVTLTTTADASNLVNLREQFRSCAEEDGLVPGYTDFLVKLVGHALGKHPLLNARWSEQGIVLIDEIHVGVAVDTEAGLVVPVVRNVPALTIRQLAGLSRDLIERARTGKLVAADMEGGTFTITNLGAFDIDAFTPILHAPQGAILGVGRISRRPAVVQDEIVVRDEVTLSLTFDHRVVDGAPAARFLQTLTRMIANPGPRLVS